MNSLQNTTQCFRMQSSNCCSSRGLNEFGYEKNTLIKF
jgi:hypothetical protein